MLEGIDENQYVFYRIASIDEVPSGDRIFFDIGDRPIMLLNVGNQFYAIGDVCTHDEGPLGDGELVGYEVVCPRHGAHFDVRNGKATKIPAVVATPWYPVRVVGNDLEVGIPK